MVAHVIYLMCQPPQSQLDLLIWDPFGFGIGSRGNGIGTRHGQIEFFLSIRPNRNSNCRKYIRSSSTVSIKNEMKSTRQSRKYKIKLEAKSYVT